MSFDKEAWKAQCRENARSLEIQINRLQSDYSDPLGFWRRYNEFWDQARRISAMFKQPLFRDDRERLWAAYSRESEEVKQVHARECVRLPGTIRAKHSAFLSPWAPRLPNLPALGFLAHPSLVGVIEAGGKIGFPLNSEPFARA